MTYFGNQLIKTSDAVSGPNHAGAFHFVDNVNNSYEYAYDQNGNMTQDLNRNILQINYNFLNLPTQVQMNSTGGMSYVYDALGTRHSKSYCVISPSGSGGGQYDYVDEFVFHNGTLEQVRFNGGFITLSGCTPQYDYKSGIVSLINNEMPCDIAEPDKRNDKFSFLEDSPMTLKDFINVLMRITYNQFE